eukprot:CAMPEP_0198529568 /NCGR_PEP_ID=MMETSP1462-20131121/25830_1 /TAXON_ID=1333877 /ORGANISM="Brandtodinium nutriculum, Strain RCC3387" /LENGTH=387 /DNA_ID=CAMNT_0044259419 /DNA_START=51 /DNA_END=1210 /DNA_ORIENTATION=-
MSSSVRAMSGMVLPSSVVLHCFSFAPLCDLQHVLSLSIECRGASLAVAKERLLTRWADGTFPTASYILKALRAASHGIDLGTAWRDLWRAAALSLLSELARARGQVEEDDDDGDGLFWDMYGDDVTDALAAVFSEPGVEHKLQDIAAFLEYLDVPTWLSNAISQECRDSSTAGRVPRADWISAWCIAGARASRTQAWLDEREETFTDEALGEIAKNKAEPSELLEVAEALFRHGAHGSGEDIAFAYARSPANPAHLVRWKRVWRDAASATMASLFRELREREERGAQFPHVSTDEMEDLLSTGYTGPHLDEALSHIDRARMRDEDFDWQLRREQTRMSDGDQDEDRCKVQRMLQERRWMSRDDRVPLVLREQLRLRREDHREGHRHL